MEQIEKTITIIGGLSIALRIIFGPVVNSILMVSLVLLAIFYLWFSVLLFNNVNFKQLFPNHPKNPKFNAFKISSSIIMGVVYSFTVISIMFSLFFYPNMELMLGLSVFLLLVSFIFWFFYYRYKKKYKLYLNKFYLRSGVYCLVCLFLIVTPVEKRLEVLFKDHPEFIEAYLNYHENPDDPEAEEELREQRNRFR